MSDVTRIISQIEQGDGGATPRLLALVYDELRRLAAAKLANERPGQTLQPTALVHEAFLRLAGSGDEMQWNGKAHFFGAAAEAMRRILVENARRKRSVKHGGEMKRQDDGIEAVAVPVDCDNLIALHDALDRLEEEDPTSAELVKLRYFAGLSIPQAAKVLGVSPRKADFLWAFARTWLRQEIERDQNR